MSQEDRGPLRDIWQAMFYVPELIDECNRRARNHQEHAEYWDNELEALRVELEESQDIETVKVTGGEQRVLRYDQGLANKVTDAEQRKARHLDKADEYRRWVILLEKKRGGGTVPLRINDVSFFFAPIEAVPVG